MPTVYGDERGLHGVLAANSTCLGRRRDYRAGPGIELVARMLGACAL